MRILSGNSWVLHGFRFQLNPTKHRFARYILSHYLFYEKKNATLPDQYLSILKNKLKHDLEKLNGAFNIKVDTLRYFAELLDSENGRGLFIRFLKAEQSPNENVLKFINESTQSFLQPEIGNKPADGQPALKKIEGRAICIAVFLHFEIENRLDEYERLYRIGITRTEKFVAEKFNIAKIPGKQNMSRFNLWKILESKNQVKPKNQLKKQLLQIAENKTVFGTKIAARADQLINKYY